jgi:hypothetical protein
MASVLTANTSGKHPDANSTDFEFEELDGLG